MKKTIYHKQPRPITLIELCCYAVIVLSIVFSCDQEEKRTSSLSSFYTTNKKEALNIVNEFADLSLRITIIVTKDSLLINYKSEDSSQLKKVSYNFQVPSIASNDSLRMIWYHLFYKLNNYKSQLDEDLINAAQEVFMFYEQNATLRNFSGTRRNIIVDTFALNKDIIGRWCTITKYLKLKSKRRLDFYN